MIRLTLPSLPESLQARVCARIGVGVMQLLLCACRHPLPTAPSIETFEGIIVYEHIDFQGRSGAVTGDIDDLSDFKGPCVESDGVGGTPGSQETWNDCISSIRVAPGWGATLYRGKNYGDDSLEITADVPDLTMNLHDCPRHGLNDCVSSIRVRRR